VTWPTDEQLDALYDEVCTWGRWGADDQGGTLAYLTRERRAAAVAAVVDGGETTNLSSEDFVPLLVPPGRLNRYFSADGEMGDDP